MKLLFDVKTKRQLAVILKFLPTDITKVYAAIAYNQSDLLLKTCIDRKIQLEWWGLLDSKKSTSFDLVRNAILSEFVKFYPFAELFHPKVIYFENYGLYIGSANMTNNALYNNVEAGVFFGKEELSNTDISEIQTFFNYLRDKSIPATSNDLEQIDKFLESTTIEREKIDRLENNVDENFEECLGHLFLLKPGVQDFGEKNGNKTDKKKLFFMQEWRETQNFLHHVKNIMLEKCVQPKWIHKDANPTIITDQLLHAYYYSNVLKNIDEGKSIEKVQESYEANKKSPENAIIGAIKWWEALDHAPSDEDIHINEWGISNEKVFQKLKTNDLSLEEFTIVMKQNHAARNHARQIKNEYFNLPLDYKTTYEERVQIFSKWLFNQKSKTGKTIHDVLRFILFHDEMLLEERIFLALNDDEYRIERLGKSIIGEIVGWGRPDITHLRNNRVNKALRCLGYDIRLFSE